MTIDEFKQRAEKFYEMLGVKDLTEFMELAGYSKSTKLSNFYNYGVSKRAEAFLLMLERKHY